MKEKIEKNVTKVDLSPDALKTMKNHAVGSFPNECCGFFFGSAGDIISVSIAQTAQNAKEGDQRRRFEINPLDYMNAEKYALEHKLDLLGIYHSHPNHPAIPSEHDLKQAVPNFSYIILSVMNGDFDHIRSWRLNEQNIFEEEIIINNH